MEVWGRGMVKHVGLESTLRPRSRSGNVNVKKDSRPLLFFDPFYSFDVPRHPSGLCEPPLEPCATPAPWRKLWLI